MTYTLILLRHGQSTWNQENLFTGWVDVPLSDIGAQEARRAGELLASTGMLPDVLHTSVLKRAIQTANIALDVADRDWIDVRRSWRLNERHYGALQGKDKAQTLAEYGPESFSPPRACCPTCSTPRVSSAPSRPPTSPSTSPTATGSTCAAPGA